MAKDFMAQMLDELMGRNRNSAPNERQDLRWDDATVCKHFLACYCPNELFTNTKADLGICKKIHDEGLKNQYQTDSKKGTLGYEDSFLRFLRTMVMDVDRRIDRGKCRIESTRQAAINNIGSAYDAKIKDLTQKIEDFVQEAEKLGSQGKVEEAQTKLRQSDQLRKDRDGIKVTLEIAAQQEKQLEVCQICAAFLIVGDAQQRIDDHLAGKQHVGYARIRETLKEEEERMQKGLDDRRKDRSEKRGEDHGGSRGRSEQESEKRDELSSRNGSGRSRSRERFRRQPESKDKNKRERSRSGSRRRDRDRSRNRRRHHSRSRSRDQSRRASKRDGNDRNRSRSKEDKRRRSRSRDRDSKRKRRSKSREEKIVHRNGSTTSDKSGSSAHFVKKDLDVSKLHETEGEQVPSLDSIHLPKSAPGEHDSNDEKMDE